ncbi:MAG: FAD-binding oxidoreductase [Candidatus Dadabacteria bacterium]|nr:MAG: FAD-binding oxidoreductase [Candidatus Dadabacteria bacterium]
MTLTDRAWTELGRIFPADRLSRGPSVLDLHSRDESFHEPRRPEAVAWPVSTDEVRRALLWAGEHGVPVTPWGAGTSIEGNPIPVRGGLVLDFAQMNRIVEVRPEDFLVTVEPGVLYTDLNAELNRRRTGLFFPPDPGAAASVGGMVANNASGIRTVRYGPTRRFVKRLEVVLADGRVIETGTLAPKTSSGLDLVGLLVGSEGTLGVFTRITLELAPLPPEVLTALVPFADAAAATRAVAAIMGSGLGVAACEFLDLHTVRVVERAARLGLPDRPLLFLEFHGTSRAGLEADAGLVEEICRAEGAQAFEAGIGPDERARLWDARHRAYRTIREAHVGEGILIVDAAVPRSRYPDLAARAREILDRRGLTGYIFGHAGDGNLHCLILGRLGDEALWASIQEANAEIVDAALGLGGTATGEHGVGLGKRRFLPREHGTSLDLMRDVKRLFDPRGLLNPGKMFPDG